MVVNLPAAVVMCGAKGVARSRPTVETVDIVGREWL
jgi:hypothetical protein